MSNQMVTFHQKGNFNKTLGFLEKTKEFFNLGILNKYGRLGVQALEENTPKDSGETAKSWYYEIENKNRGAASIYFCNSHIHDGVPIAIILQYGHGTRNGGWVKGRDYINPAIQPIFDKLLNDLWEEMVK